MASSSLGTIKAPSAGASNVAVVRLVPFRGTFPVSATWGTPTGPNHITPAIDFKMPIGTLVYATAAGSVDVVSVDNRNCNPLTHIPAGGTYADAIQWSRNSGISTGPHLHDSKINAAGTATVDPDILRGCWGTTKHNYTQPNQLIGKLVRNDGYGWNA